jgi:hypothetical protein
LPRLVFTRAAGPWYQGRRYAVVVDGRLVGQLRRGETVEVDVAPGQHLLQARVAGTGSRRVPVELAADAPPTRLMVRYAGHRFLVDALWRAFTTQRWLDLVVETPA